MRKPFPRWPQWLKDKRSWVFLGIPLLQLFCTSSYAESDPREMGADLGNWALERFGSADAIRDRTSPLTSDESLMKSLDGNTAFGAQLACPASSHYMTLSATAAATGDLSSVLLSLDRDLDDFSEYSYRIPDQVSGVCANGVIACTPGTWNDCRYFEWTADTDRKVQLNSTSMTRLGACYCINNSCGSGLSSTMLPKILRDLGGGASAALQGIDPKFAISDVQVDPSSIRYFGQSSSDCTRLPASGGSSNPEQYFGNASGLITDTQNEISVQSRDPDSFYNLMTDSLAASTAESNYPSCSRDRAITVTTTTNTINNTMSGSLCSDHFVFIRAHQVDPLTYHLQYLDTAPNTTPHWNCERRGTAGGIDDWHTLEIVNLPSPPTSFQYCLNATSACSASASTCVNTTGTQANVMTCHGAGAARPSFRMSYLFNYLEDNILETINDSCTGLERDPSCQIKDETIDGVVTYANYNPTNLSALSSCQTFNGSLGSYVECRPWWETDRNYRCETGPMPDFSDLENRLAVVQGSVTDRGTSLGFSDLLKQPDGSITNESNNILLPERAPASNCQMACKTSRPTVNTDAALSGNATQFQTSSNSADIYYKSCTVSPAGDDVCPLESGETLLKDCQCQNDFAEAAAMMQVLQSAGEDLFCDGTVDTSTGLCSGQIRIFEGKEKRCRPRGTDTSFFNCCDSGSSSSLEFLRHCQVSEQESGEAVANGRTHEIGTYCKRRDPVFGSCLQDERSYCAFTGKLGRIVHEQGRLQLQRFAPDGRWGTPERPNCSGFSPEEFQMLQFDEIDLSEFFGDISTRAQNQIQSEMGSKIDEFYRNTRP